MSYKGKILVFDIWGDFAHFRKFYVNTSPSTYSFPPPPTVRGILGCIIGIPMEETHKLNFLDVAVQILNPVRKINFSINYINTKREENREVNFLSKVLEKDGLPRFKKEGIPRTQICMEFLKDPYFRIFLKVNEKAKSEDEEEILYFWNKIKEFLRGSQSVFTVYLGISECLARFKYVGEFSFKKKEVVNTIHSVVPNSILDKEKSELKLLPIKHALYTEKVPLIIKDGREPVSYEEAIVNDGSIPIKGRLYGHYFYSLLIENQGEDNKGVNVAFFEGEPLDGKLKRSTIGEKKDITKRKGSSKERLEKVKKVEKELKIKSLDIKGLKQFLLF